VIPPDVQNISCCDRFPLRISPCAQKFEAHDIGGDPPIQLTNLQEELTYLLSTVKEFGCNPFDIDFVSFELGRTKLT
jgi:hypothetical protein